MTTAIKQHQRKKRHKRVRSKIHGTRKRPRFSVFRSNKYIYAQLIDDEKGRTLVCVSVQEIESKKQKLTKISTANEVGKLLAKKAKKLKIKSVVFDRAGYKYHGRVKAVAEGARQEGLKF